LPSTLKAFSSLYKHFKAGYTMNNALPQFQMTSGGYQCLLCGRSAFRSRTWFDKHFEKDHSPQLALVRDYVDPLRNPTPDFFSPSTEEQQLLDLSVVDPDLETILSDQDDARGSNAA